MCVPLAVSGDIRSRSALAWFLSRSAEAATVVFLFGVAEWIEGWADRRRGGRWERCWISRRKSPR
jgi:hypothetical protein